MAFYPLCLQTVLQRIAQSAWVPASGGEQALLQQLGGPWELATALQKPGQRHPPAWHVRHAVSGIVRASSHRQLVAGFLSAGVSKSVRYAFSKLKKAWR